MKIKKVKSAKIKEINKKEKITVVSKNVSLESQVTSQDSADSSIFRTSGFINTGLSKTEVQSQVSEIQETKKESSRPAVVYSSQPNIQDMARKYEVNSLQSQRTQNSAILRPVFSQQADNNILSHADSRLQHQDIQTKYYEPGKLDDIKVKRRNPWDG